MSKLPCPKCALFLWHTAAQAGEDLHDLNRDLSIVCDAAPVAPSDEDECQCGADWLPEEGAPLPQFIFYVLAIMIDQEVISYLAIDGWYGVPLDSPDVWVFRNKEIAECHKGSYHIKPVHLLCLHKDALPR